MNPEAHQVVIYLSHQITGIFLVKPVTRLIEQLLASLVVSKAEIPEDECVLLLCTVFLLAEAAGASDLKEKRY